MDEREYDGTVMVQGLHGCNLIITHQTAVTLDIRAENRRELAPGRMTGFIEKVFFPKPGPYPGAAQNRLDPADHFPGAEGFADIIIRTQFQPQQSIDFFHPGRHHDDGHI
jgi:hypothetical protein